MRWHLHQACVKWASLKITLTFAEEKFGVSHADLSLRRGDLHLEGGWVKERRQNQIWISLLVRRGEWWHRGKAQKRQRSKSNCIACSKEQPFFRHSLCEWISGMKFPCSLECNISVCKWVTSLDFPQGACWTARPLVGSLDVFYTEGTAD